MVAWISLVILTSGLALIGVIKYYYPGYKDDNIIEEVLEEVIKEKTGFDIDLTPGSPEKK